MKMITIVNAGINSQKTALKGQIMDNLLKKSIAALTVFSLMTLGLILAGCGGGSGAVSSQVVSGTAAVGSPLSGQA